MNIYQLSENTFFFLYIFVQLHLLMADEKRIDLWLADESRLSSYPKKRRITQSLV
jgi:hypothetical protein